MDKKAWILGLIVVLVLGLIGYLLYTKNNASPQRGKSSSGTATSTQETPAPIDTETPKSVATPDTTSDASIDGDIETIDGVFNSQNESELSDDQLSDDSLYIQ